ncbi:glucose-6-phosphate isomerase [bacterium]|nr:glucose-6-phosphate isomerase [bacterium]
MDKVRLNFANCMQEKVGKQGIKKEELEEFSPLIREAHQNIQKKKQNDVLGFMQLPYQKSEAEQIKSFAHKNKIKFDNLVVIGIGGSALGNIALQTALNHPFYNLLSTQGRKGSPRIFVLDNVDPIFTSGLLDVLDLEKTLFNIVSKSGNTAEGLANFFILKQALQDKIGDKCGQHILVTTDKEKGFLREKEVKEAFSSFIIPRNVGGRFSVLSPVGLVSAAFSGIDIELLLSGAELMDNVCNEPEIWKNPAYMYAAIQFLMYKKGKKINVMMPYAHNLKDIADWFRQLWAESLGKKFNNNGEIVNVGPTPVKALGVTDQHSQMQLYMEGPFDKIITFLSVSKFGLQMEIPGFYNHYLKGHTLQELLKSEEKATSLALTQNNRPNVSLVLPQINEHTIGQLIYLLEMATVCMGELFGIDALNQPGVELGKELTYALMGRAGYEEKKKELEQKEIAADNDLYII